MLLRPDPYEYSSGRWLRNDVAHQEARRISFNFDALCRRVIHTCLGAKSILSYEKKEGGNNRVFIFKTDNKKVIVAKLPFVNAGPARLTNQSEVATIRFLKKHSNIPIPRIYDWNDDRSNEIGSEYILMDHAPGVSLEVKWPSMSIDQRIQCIHNIYHTLSPLNEIPFPAYGSLYTTDFPLTSAVRITKDDEYCVGPHVDARYWGCNVGDHRYYHRVPPNRGPWEDVLTWSDGLIDAGISRIPPRDGQSVLRPRYFGTVDMHLRLVDDARRVLKEMSKDPRVRAAATPALFHPDFHKRAIFVSENDPTVVTSIIDWQSTSVEPAFWFAGTSPDFAALPDRVGSVTNENVTSEPGPEVMVCVRAFDACMKCYLPILAGPRSLNEDLLRVFQYGHRTWNDGAVALRHDLIITLQNWRHLGFEEPCPIPVPGPEEIIVHDRDYRLFVAAQRLQRQVTDYLNTSSEGWVPTDAWDLTKSQHHELYHNALQAIQGNEAPDDSELVKTEDDLKAIWPFDL